LPNFSNAASRSATHTADAQSRGPHVGAASTCSSPEAGSRSGRHPGNPGEQSVALTAPLRPDPSARVPVRGAPAADESRARRQTVRSRSRRAAIAKAQTSSSVTTAGRPRRARRRRATCARSFMYASVVGLAYAGIAASLTASCAAVAHGSAWFATARSTSRESAAGAARTSTRCGFSIGLTAGKGHSRTCGVDRLCSRPAPQGAEICPPSRARSAGVLRRRFEQLSAERNRP
jgi:hypothetical protein